MSVERDLLNEMAAMLRERSRNSVGECTYCGYVEHFRCDYAALLARHAELPCGVCRGAAKIPEHPDYSAVGDVWIPCPACKGGSDERTE